MSQFVIQYRGQKISLRAQADPAIAQETFELVQRFLEDAEARTRKGAPSEHLVLLALLDLAEEYVAARLRAEEYRSGLAVRTARILEMLDGQGA